MRSHVALLRSVNVGGHNPIAMADLREVATSLGHVDVATYVQSGNVVFTSSESDATKLADALETAITGHLGLRTGVVVLSRQRLTSVVGANPFPLELDPRSLHVVFRRRALTAEMRAAVGEAQRRAGEKGSSDEAAVTRGTLYLRTPNGMGRSELAAQLARSPTLARGEAAGTTRNWATVTKLMELLRT